ncbi:MAG: hypothetical protein ACK5JS_09920 [Mangrovibacterium sp.]
MIRILYAIQARYTDAYGNEITREGTYTGKEVDLFGFDEATENIPVEIGLLNFDNVLSDIQMTSFSTEKSAAAAVFDNLEIKSGWDGFRVQYPELDEYAEGIISIFYVGHNQFTNTENDTMLLGSYPITPYAFSVDFIVEDTISSSTVVVTTEDVRGNIVNKRIERDIPVARSEQYNSANLALLDGPSMENTDKKTGIKYLFDGDRIGYQCLGADGGGKLYSFYSGTGVLTEEIDTSNSTWTFDLGTEQEVAQVRVYSHLNASTTGVRGDVQEPMKDTLNTTIRTRWRFTVYL